MGFTDLPLHGFWPEIDSAPITTLIAQSMRRAGAAMLAERGYALDNLIVSAGQYINPHAQPLTIEAGPITRDNLFTLYPFSNALEAYEITSADLRLWLEASVRVYQTIKPNQGLRDLVTPDYRLQDLESVFGLSYDIDLSQPAYKPHLPAGNQALGRIRNIRHQGHLVQPTDTFILLTHTYRAGGGGGFPKRAKDQRLPLPPRDIRNAIQEHLAKGETPHVAMHQPWTFLPIKGASARIMAHPKARDHMPHRYPSQLTPVPSGKPDQIAYALDLENAQPQQGLQSKDTKTI